VGLPRSFALLVLVLAVCEAGCVRQDASGTAPSAAQSEAPKKLWPVEMAAHVEALARAGRLDEARVWWFRGVMRSLVWDSLAQAYAAETFNRGVTANILRLSDVDMEAYAQLQLSALEWEATAALDLPEQFPSGSLEKLPQIRAQLSAYIRGGIEAERQRRAPIDVIKKQIAENRPVDEAIAVIPEANRNLFSLSAAVFTGCDFGLDFAVQSGGASVSDGGRLAAISSCNQLQIIDMTTGAIVQAISELEDRHDVLAVYPDSREIGILTFQSGPLSDPKTGFYRMTPRVTMERIDLPLPSNIPRTGNLSIQRSVASADGRIAILEMCAEPACPIFAAYDLVAQKIVWQSGDPDKGHERLMAYVIKVDQDYILVSELRPSDRQFAGADGTETLNLTTGASSRTNGSTLEFGKKPSFMPLCSLGSKATNAVSTFDYEIRWPDGRAPTVLKDPVRASIDDCAISPDGQALLVIVAPFIYRYEIRESKKVGASKN
jgi:hypothetical protein